MGDFSCGVRNRVVCCTCMPRIARTRVSPLQSSSIRFIGATVGVGGLIILGALFLGFSDKGAIDVSGKITSTDQSGFANKVNAPNGSADANGGLRTVSEDPNAPVAPEPQSPPLTPMNEGGEVASASSTEPEGATGSTTETTVEDTASPEQPAQ